MISFTQKHTKYERVPTVTTISTWNVTHILSDNYSWKMTAYAITNYAIIFFKTGIYEFTCSHKSEQLMETNVLCVAPNQSFQLRAIGNTKSELYIVEFDCINFSFFSLRNYLIAHLNKSDEAMFHNLEFAYNAHKEDYIVDSYLIQLIHYISSRMGKRSNQSELVIKIQEYIRNHVHERLTVSQIARALNYNKDYLARTLQKHQNISLKNLIVEEKLRIAKNLLAFTDYPVAKVGSQLGFESTNEFHKFFKYHVKTTPAAYRLSQMR